MGPDRLDGQDPIRRTAALRDQRGAIGEAGVGRIGVHVENHLAAQNVRPQHDAREE